MSAADDSLLRSSTTPSDCSVQAVVTEDSMHELARERAAAGSPSPPSPFSSLLVLAFFHRAGLAAPELTAPMTFVCQVFVFYSLLGQNTKIPTKQTSRLAVAAAASSGLARAPFREQGTGDQTR